MIEWAWGKVESFYHSFEKVGHSLLLLLKLLSALNLQIEANFINNLDEFSMRSETSPAFKHDILAYRKFSVDYWAQYIVALKFLVVGFSPS